ncbi:MAG: hypothetical protein QM784_22660 [Polyangiaceae bacterium]
MSNQDITRTLDQPEKHYVAGRQQQGRPLVDSEYNESQLLAERDRQAALLAMLGPKASPAQGFAIGTSSALYRKIQSLRPIMEGDHLRIQRLVLGGTTQWVHNVTIMPGSIYLGGLRFEQFSAEHVALQRGYLQMQQGEGLPYLNRTQSPSPHSPRSPQLVYSPSSPSSPYSPLRSPHSPGSPDSPDFPSFRNFYFLNAWEQEVTAIEDEELLEPALGGPDTTVRVRRMHRVEVLGNLPRYIDSCGEAFEELIRRLEANNGRFNRETYALESRARLRLMFQEPALLDQCRACTLDPDARYLGQENQTLRVMLTQARRYVWAFDNGAPLYRIKITGLSASNPSKVRVHLLTPPKDHDHFPRRHQVAEIIPFGAVLEGAEDLNPNHPHFQKIADEIGAFVRVSGDYDPNDNSFEIETGPTTELTDRIQRIKRFVTRWSEAHPASRALNIADRRGSDARYFYLRLWHIADEPWQIELPTSADPRGQSLGDTGIVPVFYSAGRPGDTWRATLRVDEPYRITPYDLLTTPGGVAPHGPRHYYAPLALVSGDGTEVYDASDCRKTIKRVTERSCATRTVGDGQVSFGDYASIQRAIDSLPIEGGTILIYPGEYREVVNLSGRGKITLQGCGQSTILEALSYREGQPAAVHITDCAQITLTNLRIHAAQEGVHITTSSDVTLTQVTLVAGTIQGGRFDATVITDATRPLISTSNLNGLSLSALSLVAGPRQALHLESTSRIRAVGLENAGESGSGTVAPAGGYAQLRYCQDVEFEDLSLAVFGRVGLDVDSTSSVVMRNVSLDGLPRGTNPPQSVLVLGASCHDFDIAESRFALDSTVLCRDAVLSLCGSNLLVEDSNVEVTAENPNLVWGGVWLRSGATNTVIRNNRILGGYGHGITLGSVQWLAGTPAAEPSPLPGPGAGHMTVVFSGDTPHHAVRGEIGSYLLIGTTSYSPTYDPRGLSGITLSSNHIEGMGGNGISVLVLQTNNQPLAMTLEDVVIDRNTITGNLLDVRYVPRDTTHSFTAPRVYSTSVREKNTRIDLPPLVFGAVVLAVVNGHTVIRGNGLTNNRPSGTDHNALGLPINGIFLWAGDDVTIADNRITENGVAHPTDAMPQNGIRAGIAVLATGLGRLDPNDGSRSVSNLLDNSSPDNTAFPKDRSALRVYNNTVRHPEGRALQAVCFGTAAVFGNFFSSDGYRGGTADVEQSLVGDVVFLEDVAVPWERRGVVPSEHVATGRRPVTPVSSTSPDLGGFGSSTAAGNFRGNRRGGHLLFNSNQITFAWDHVLMGSGTVSYYPVALYSLDHVGVHGNQLTFRVGSTTSPGNITTDYRSPFTVGAPLVTQLFAAGHTVNVAHNRFCEGLGSTLFSGVGYGQFLCLVAHNQGSHEFAAYGSGFVNTQLGTPGYAYSHPRVSQFENQVLYAAPAILPGARSSTSRTGARTFFERQFRILDTQGPVNP